MNKVILMGRLTRDPEIRQTQSQKTVAGMSIAVDRRLSREAAATARQTADFINLVAWDKLAEFARNWLHKGTKVVVEGRLTSRSYEAQDGSKRYVTEVVVENIEFAESKRAASESGFAASAPGGAPTAGLNPAMASPEDEEVPFM